MKDWKQLKIGDKVLFTVNDFDGKINKEGVVESCFNDHIIILVDDIRVWLDDNFESMFHRL